MGNGSISGCCEKPRKTVTAAAVANIELAKKETRNGNVRFYPGARTSDDKYTSPVLSIRVWNRSVQNISTQRGNLNAIERSRDGASTQLTEAGRKDEYKLDFDGEIHIIPVEDVVKISISTEIKKTLEQNKTVRVKTPPPEDSGCCTDVKKCCMRNICCWCCTETKVAPEHVTKMTEKTKAARAIVLTVEHLSYSLIHTPSAIKVLATVPQQEFYQKYGEVKKLKFYYLHNDEFDGEDYKKQLDESETLTRVVLQLKAMSDHYPDSSQIQQILFQQNLHLFGVDLDEKLYVLEGSTTVTTALHVKHTTNDN